MTTERERYVPARTHTKLTPAKALRIIREFQELSQAELAELSGIPQPTISAIENGQKGLGIERAKQLAQALKVHPAVLAFADWTEPANVTPLHTAAVSSAPKRAKAVHMPTRRSASARGKFVFASPMVARRRQKTAAAKPVPRPAKVRVRTRSRTK